MFLRYRSSAWVGGDRTGQRWNEDQQKCFNDIMEKIKWKGTTSEVYI